METSTKVRDSFFDNYKAFLILCVVIGHFLNHFTNDFKIAEILRIYIYFFHIPAFSFISGYFARKNQPLMLIKKLLVPYVIFQCIYYFLYSGIGIDVDFSLISPFFTLWYIVALFFWRLVINQLDHIRLLIPISMICSVLIGFVPGCNEILDIYRIIAFFPFFVMGHRFKRDKFQKIIHWKYAKVLSAILMTVLFIVVCFKYRSLDISVLNCQDSYEVMGIEDFGWIQRMIHLPFATCLIFAIGILMPKQQHCYTKLGKYTMRVYLCHGVIYRFLSLGTDALDLVNSTGDFIIYIMAVILLAFSLSHIPLEPFLDFLISIPEKIFSRMRHQYT
jgi:fucose 4-O-acetylase-like acetyltransferase